MSNHTIPIELQQQNCWLVHKSKKPFNALTGQPGAQTDPSSWVSYGQAVVAWQNFDYSGLGFNPGGSPYTVLDLDKCITPWGCANAFATSILARLPDCYTELSPSGTGLHIFIEGKVPRNTKNLAAGIEFFSLRSHYVTMTGNVWDGRRTLKSMNGQLDSIFAEYGEPEPQRAEIPQNVSLLDVAELVGRLRLISPEDRDTWMKVGMALKSQDEALLDLWLEWSQQSGKFDHDDAMRVWDSMHGGQINITWLIAQSRAYIPPMPDVEQQENIQAAASLEDRISKLTPVHTPQDLDALLVDMIRLDNAATVDKFLPTLARHSLVGVGGLKARIKQLEREMRAAARAAGAVDWELSEAGAKMETKRNMEVLFQKQAIHLAFNMMTNSLESPQFPGQIDIIAADRENYIIGEVQDMCTREAIGIGRTSQIMLRVGQDNRYHPMAVYLGKAERWDGRDRIDQVLRCLPQPEGMTPEQVQLGRSMFIKWCISAIACTHGYYPGWAPRGMLIIIGAQSTGKTSFFRYLCPKGMYKEGQHLDPKNKDNVEQVTSTLFVEVGEFERTMKSGKSAGDLKAFISRDVDEYRKAYAHEPVKRPRCTIFAGTVNHKEFNFDQTGGSRFWPIEITGKIDLDTIRIMGEQGGGEQLQFWKQIEYLFRDGYGYHLTDDEMDLLNARNLDHTVKTDADIVLDELYDWSTERTNKRTLSEVLEKAQKVQKSITPGQLKEALQLKGLHAPKWATNRGGLRKRFWLVPDLYED